MTEPLEPNDVYDTTSTSVLDRVKTLTSAVRSRTRRLRHRVDESTREVRANAGRKMSNAAAEGGAVDRTEAFISNRLEQLRTELDSGTDRAFHIVQKGVNGTATLTRRGAAFITKRL